MDRLRRRSAGTSGTGVPRTSLLVATVLAASIVGCGKAPPAPPTPPPPAVTVAKPLSREVVEWDTYNGYLDAKESVNVAARVSGLVVDVPFDEGSIVKKGQVLYFIDDRPFKADLDLKQADEEKAKAGVALSLANLRRAEATSRNSAMSQAEFDTSKADYAKAVATQAGAKAAAETARLNLEWCRVTSPIDGRVGRKVVTAGNLVTGGGGPASPTLLTTIQSVDPIYCYFDVDERSIQKYQRLAAEKKRPHERDGRVPCYVRVGGDTGAPHPGRIDFLDNRLEVATGTQRMRAVLPNGGGVLTPGFYAGVRIPGSGRYTALLVPDAAVGNDQSQRTVLVLGKDNVVQVRVVEIGALFGDMRAVTAGLTADDAVVVNGQLRAFPGAPVTPTETTLQFDATGSEPALTLATSPGR